MYFNIIIKFFIFRTCKNIETAHICYAVCENGYITVIIEFLYIAVAINLRNR